MAARGRPPADRGPLTEREALPVRPSATRRSGPPTTRRSTAWPTSCCRPCRPSSPPAGSASSRSARATGASACGARPTGSARHRRRGDRAAVADPARPRRPRPRAGGGRGPSVGHGARRDGAARGRTRPPRRRRRRPSAGRRPGGRHLAGRRHLPAARRSSAPGTRVRAGDRLGVVDLLGVRPGGRAPGRRHRRRLARRGRRRRRVRPGARPPRGGGRSRRDGRLMFRKILIANRGEIALRILRACRTLGIEAVVAYSEADRESLPVQLADEAICIGPPDARRSLPLGAGDHQRRARDRLRRHPSGLRLPVRGRGLRRGRPGPRPHVHRPAAGRPRALRLEGGDPTPPRRRTACRRSRAPTACCATTPTPSPRPTGSATRSSSSRRPAAAARACGWSGLARELEAALQVCRSEARAAFGDDSLYLEKWLEDNRHVEVQVAVDRYGHGVHLGERDCSVQRRHQKILEEAPSPALGPAARADLAERAVAAVVAAGYENVGTLEFLVDGRGDFYFIEINCRIQVEHPVTEMLTGHRPRRDPDPDRRRRAARVQPGRRRAPRPRHRVPDQRRGPGPRLPAERRHRRAVPSRRAVPASGWTPTLTPATRCRRSTTRSSASSSSGARTGRPRSPAARVALDELVIEGLVDQRPDPRGAPRQRDVPRGPLDDEPPRPGRQRGVPRGGEPGVIGRDVVHGLHISVRTSPRHADTLGPIIERSCP